MWHVGMDSGWRSLYLTQGRAAFLAWSHTGIICELARGPRTWTVAVKQDGIHCVKSVAAEVAPVDR
jgi:hypothetical protein